MCTCKYSLHNIVICLQTTDKDLFIIFIHTPNNSNTDLINNSIINVIKENKRTLACFIHMHTHTQTHTMARTLRESSASCRSTIQETLKTNKIFHSPQLACLTLTNHRRLPLTHQSSFLYVTKVFRVVFIKLNEEENYGKIITLEMWTMMTGLCTWKLDYNFRNFHRKVSSQLECSKLHLWINERSSFVVHLIFLCWIISSFVTFGIAVA